jgi:glycine/D-amino acid oxidase-like deaminating enzyme
VRHGTRQATITTPRGTLRANAVVLATAAPRPLVPALQRHVRVDHTYTVVTEPLPTAMRRAVPGELLVRFAAPSPLTFTLGPQQRLVLQGGEQPPVSARALGKALVQRAGQLMYELSLRYPSISGLQPEYVWSAPRVTARDGLLLAGTHRAFPQHLFALGLGGLGLTGAVLAARLLLRLHQGRPEAGDELFGFGRIVQ